MAQIDYSERFWEVEYTYLSADDWFREGATHDSLAAATDAMEGMRVRRLNIATFEYRVVEVNITRTVVTRADEVATWVVQQ